MFARGLRRFLSTKYTKQHEYVIQKNKELTIGITDFAQNQLGDVVFVDLPSVGDSFEKGDVFGSVESVKAASDVYMPANGQITEINEQLAESPHLVNEAAMTEGWFVKCAVEEENNEDLSKLLNEEEYIQHCDTEEH